jgi:hypothetical protein
LATLEYKAATDVELKASQGSSRRKPAGVAWNKLDMGENDETRDRDN